MFLSSPAQSQYSIEVRARVTELMELVLVLKPFLVSRVDLTGLASKQQATSSKPAHKKWGKITAPSRCFAFCSNFGRCYLCPFSV